MTMTVTLPLNPTTTRRLPTTMKVTGLVLGLTLVIWALSVALIQTRAERTALQQVIAFRDCVGRVTDLMIEANADGTQPSLMHSTAISTLCDTLTFGGTR